MIDASEAFVATAFERMAEVARLTGRHVNARPLGEETNSVAALVAHCAGVAEFWLGHVALARPSRRDREAEFGAVLWWPEVQQVAAAAAGVAVEDLRAIQGGASRPSEMRALLPGDGSDAVVVLHVVEELFQHLGHMEATLDALRAAGALDEPLFHLALRDDWDAAAPSGSYERSTRGRCLAEEGFIHCSFADQVEATAARYYADAGPLVLLRIEQASVRDLLRVEDLTDSGVVFPHLYGPLPVDLVDSVTEVRLDEHGRLDPDPSLG